MKKLSLLLLLGALLIGAVFFVSFWGKTQPVWLSSKTVDDKVLSSLPYKNKQIIDFIEATGKTIAPSYNEAVCTEFVTKVIDKFAKLTKVEQADIRIITKENLKNLIENESSIIRGIQTALTKSGKGVEMVGNKEVLPGDFVQFWNIYQNKAYGHCGVVLDIEPNKSLTLYSSHPLTSGYGKQKYWWPDKAFFVRLK